jgi:hypothetical protein
MLMPKSVPIIAVKLFMKAITLKARLSDSTFFIIIFSKAAISFHQMTCNFSIMYTYVCMYVYMGNEQKTLDTLENGSVTPNEPFAGLIYGTKIEN